MPAVVRPAPRWDLPRQAAAAARRALDKTLEARKRQAAALAGRLQRAASRASFGLRGAWSRPSTPRVAASRSRSASPRLPRFKPILLSDLLGKDAIRPPRTQAKVPDLSGLLAKVPKTDAEGKPLKWAPAQAAAVEKTRTPESRALACKDRKPHWHPERPGHYHIGPAWGRWDGAAWLWLKRDDSRWWAWTAPRQPTWLRHGEHWWWRSDGIWFMLHEGEAWGYRLFQNGQAEGFIHPATGTSVIYSADGRRVAMITPGDGAWLFDARTGEVLGRWTEAQMPAKAKPSAPKTVSFPP